MQKAEPEPEPDTQILLSTVCSMCTHKRTILHTSRKKLTGKKEDPVKRRYRRENYITCSVHAQPRVTKLSTVIFEPTLLQGELF